MIAEIKTSGKIYGNEIDIIGTAKGDGFLNYTSALLQAIPLRSRHIVNL
jgi:hypothetical protein